MPQTYTAADFERYHSGKMSEIEMNALEKAALEDPFVADALEGYAHSLTPEKDINELKEKLFSNKKKKKIFFINKKENAWMKIAASIILIAGMGYLAYVLNSGKQDYTLAKSEMQSDLNRSTEKPDNSKMDSLVADKTEKTALNSLPEKKKEFALNREVQQNTITKEIPTSKPESNSIQDDKISPLPANADKALLKKSTLLDVKRNDENIENERNFLKGKVEDTLGNAIAFVKIRGKNQPLNTTTDADGRFKVVTKDSSITATVAAPGYKTKNVMLRDKNEQLIVMEHDKKDLSEVAVTAYGMQKQKRALASAEILEGKASGVIVNNSTQQQITEQEKFDVYVRKNIRIPKNEFGENYKGKVVLSFDTNKKGYPKNIKADQSLCADCDKEAIRLLEKSPKWKYIKKQRQVVTVQF